MTEYERLIKRLILLLRLKTCIKKIIISLNIPLPELNYITSVYASNRIDDHTKHDFIFYGYNNNKPIKPLKKEIGSNTYKNYISALDVIKPYKPYKNDKEKKWFMEYQNKFVPIHEEIKPMQTGVKNIEEIEPPYIPERKLYPLDKNIFVPLKKTKKTKKIKIRFEDL